MWAAAAADLAVLLVFVAIGRRTHHSGSDGAGFVGVLWPFAVGLVAGWLVTGIASAPLAWRRSVPAWLVTVGVGMALRVGVAGHAFKLSFTIVAFLFVGAGMLDRHPKDVVASRVLAARRAA